MMQTVLLLRPPPPSPRLSFSPHLTQNPISAAAPTRQRRPTALHLSATAVVRPFSCIFPVFSPKKRHFIHTNGFRLNDVVASAAPPSVNPSAGDESAKLAQVAKRLEKTSRYFRRLGSFGFWGQLVCTLVAAVILSFSTVVSSKITAPVTFYLTAAGIAAAFISVFWSFGYIRLSERLRRTANDPAKAPPRADVVKSLKNGIVLNIIGMGATILGMQATVGSLVAKALTTSSVPYYQGISPGQSPVLALDVFLVQASANTILSHFFGLASSLELLRSVTAHTLEPASVAGTG